VGTIDTVKREKLNYRLLTSNYPSDLVPQILDMPSSLDPEDIVATPSSKQASREVDTKITRGVNPNDIPVPLTEAQAAAADLRIKTALANIGVARQKIKDLRLELDKKIKDLNNESTSFSIDIKGKPRLVRAIKKLWGEKKTEITFDMYKELLEAKQILEKQEVKNFSSGKIKR
jgi:hypothetical protein